VSARLTFKIDQVTGLPELLYAVHSTLSAAEANAHSAGMDVDWTQTTITARTYTDDPNTLVVTVDPRYIEGDGRPVTQYALGVDGEDPRDSDLWSDAFDNAEAARAAVSGDRERVMSRTVTPWKEHP
jgi:hypothetical protein